MIASITKIIISHFAISIEKPAIPCAPNIYAIKASIKKNIARPIKPVMFLPSKRELTYTSAIIYSITPKKLMRSNIDSHC